MLISFELWASDISVQWLHRLITVFKKRVINTRLRRQDDVSLSSTDPGSCRQLVTWNGAWERALFLIVVQWRSDPWDVSLLVALLGFYISTTRKVVVDSICMDVQKTHTIVNVKHFVLIPHKSNTSKNDVTSIAAAIDLLLLRSSIWALYLWWHQSQHCWCFLTLGQWRCIRFRAVTPRGTADFVIDIVSHIMPSCTFFLISKKN